MDDSLICVLLAALSGCALTAAAVVVAFPEVKARERNEKISPFAKNCHVLLNIIYCTLAVGANILAVRFGPVAVATPVQLGANLLSNMVTQRALRIAHYSQNQIVGTFILVSSVTMLTEVGPKDIDAETTSVTDLLLNPMALSFIILTVLVLIVSMCTIASGKVKQNLYLVFLYSLVGGTDSVINTALSKVMQMPDISIWILIPMVVVYAILAVIGVANGAQANGALEDPSLFIPIGAAVSLVLTCLAGLFIWGDGSRLDHPLTYASIYMIVVLASYVVSEDDLLAITQLRVNEGCKKKVKNRKDHVFVNEDYHPEAPHGKFARQNSARTWKEHLKSSEHSTDEMIELIEAVLAKYSPMTLKRPGFSIWLNARLNSRPSKESVTNRGLEEPFLESRGRSQSSCRCVIC
mmetsp:Transcript_65605/g.114338  ORF Transcript_65605/g.114338 Transcript_65605/m.114338 type:complete len:408 (-) Transcript_65605:108-1331(-)